MTKQEVAKLIDHTNLSAAASKKDIETLCAQAVENGFATVCVNPVQVPFAAELLAKSDVGVCTVIGFPLGADTTDDKAEQAARAVQNGADEIDMVIDIGAAKEGRWDDLLRDIGAVVCMTRAAAEKAHTSALVKVILETCYLTDEEIVGASTAAKAAGADFVKTSTGFATPKDKDGKPLPNGATVHAVALMRKTVGDAMGVKASGGIRTAESARQMLAAGANRLGTSSGIAILDGWEADVK